MPSAGKARSATGLPGRRRHGGHRHRKAHHLPRRIKYQIVIDSMEIAGEGALLKMLEDRRKKLAAEGCLPTSARNPPLTSEQHWGGDQPDRRCDPRYSTSTGRSLPAGCPVVAGQRPRGQCGGTNRQGHLRVQCSTDRRSSKTTRFAHRWRGGGSLEIFGALTKKSSFALLQIPNPRHFGRRA